MVSAPAILQLGYGHKKLNLELVDNAREINALAEHMYMHAGINAHNYYV